MSSGGVTSAPRRAARRGRVGRGDAGRIARDAGTRRGRAIEREAAHLRLWNGQYILVQPHWRGDPQVGIVKPAYEVDRTSSRWAS